MKSILFLLSQTLARNNTILRGILNIVLQIIFLQHCFLNNTVVAHSISTGSKPNKDL